MAAGSLQHVFTCVLFTLALPCTALPNKEEKNKVQGFYLMDYCNKTLDMGSKNMEEIIVQVMEPGYYYDSDMDCYMTVTVRPGFRIIFNVLYLSVDTCADSLTVYGSTVPGDVIHSRMCVKPSGVMLTSAETGTLRFTSNGSGNKGGVKVLVTAFTNSMEDKCQAGYSDCANFRCIHEDLFCNDRNNCGDNSDEGCEKTGWIYTIIGVVAGLALIATCTVVIWCYMAKRSNSRMSKWRGTPAITPGYNNKRLPGYGFSSQDTEFTGSTITHPYDCSTTEYSKSEGFTFSSPASDAYTPAAAYD